MMRASASVGVVATSRPATRTLPAVMGMRRLTRDSSVDLPAPLGPMMAVSARSGTSKLSSCSTAVPPWRLSRSRTSIIGSPCA